MCVRPQFQENPLFQSPADELADHLIIVYLEDP